MRMRESLLVLCSHHVGWHQLLSSYLALTLELQLEILRENYKIKIHDYSIPQREGRVASRQHADSKTSVTFPLTGLLKEITKHKQCIWSWSAGWVSITSGNADHLHSLIAHQPPLHECDTLLGSSLLSDLPLSYLTISHNLIPHKISFTSIKYQT